MRGEEALRELKSLEGMIVAVGDRRFRFRPAAGELKLAQTTQPIGARIAHRSNRTLYIVAIATESRGGRSRPISW